VSRDSRATQSWVGRNPGRAGCSWSFNERGRVARRRASRSVETLIELPTFAIVAPSNGETHPSRRPHVQVSGSFDNDRELRGGTSATS